MLHRDYTPPPDQRTSSPPDTAILKNLNEVFGDQGLHRDLVELAAGHLLDVYKLGWCLREQHQIPGVIDYRAARHLLDDDTGTVIIRHLHPHAAVGYMEMEHRLYLPRTVTEERETALCLWALLNGSLCPENFEKGDLPRTCPEVWLDTPLQRATLAAFTEGLIGVDYSGPVPPKGGAA